MAQVYTSNLERDGEVRPFKAHGKAVIGSAGGAAFTRGTFEPGWRWSADVGPIAGTASCQVRHLGYVVSGSMHIITDDGTEFDITPGDIFDLPAGHDAFVTSKEPCVMFDISPDATRYAKGATTPAPQSEDRYIPLVRKGFEAFNTGDIATLTTLLSHDVIQHVPGNSQIAGDYKGIDAVLGLYGKLAELTDGTVRAHLIECYGDGHGHVVALFQTTATRKGVTRVSRSTLVFTFLGEKATDLLELHADQAGDDAFFA